VALLRADNGTSPAQPFRVEGGAPLGCCEPVARAEPAAPMLVGASASTGQLLVFDLNSMSQVAVGEGHTQSVQVGSPHPPAPHHHVPLRAGGGSHGQPCRPRLPCHAVTRRGVVGRDGIRFTCFTCFTCFT
jgi:hypothetical protein